MGKKLKGIMKKSRSKLRKVIWGDLEDYNYVTETSLFTNFFIMQLFRLINIIALLCCFGVYGYIYLRYAVYNYNFWALTLTLIAFVSLFIGSGKQKVYQILVGEKRSHASRKKPKINYDDKKKKSNMWTTGVFFYTQAIPFVVVSNIIYFVDFKGLGRMLPQKYLNKHPFLNMPG